MQKWYFCHLNQVIFLIQWYGKVRALPIIFKHSVYWEEKQFIGFAKMSNLYLNKSWLLHTFEPLVALLIWIALTLTIGTKHVFKLIDTWSTNTGESKHRKRVFKVTNCKLFFSLHLLWKVATWEPQNNCLMTWQ